MVGDAFDGEVHGIRFLSLAALGQICLASLALSAATLPFGIENRDGEWKQTVVQKPVAPGINLELILTHAAGPERLVVLNSPRADDRPAALAEFGHRIKEAFTAYRSGKLTEEDATKIGYAGRELRFQLVNARETLDCELFVFPAGPDWWALLYSRPRDASTVATAAHDPMSRLYAERAGVVTIPPVRVKDIPVSSFSLSLEITRNAAGDRVAGIVVTGVPAGSLAEQAGIRAGDAIIAINRRKVEEFAAGVEKDSEIGRVFLNRGPGDTVQLELRRAGVPDPFTVHLKVANLLDMIRTDAGT